MQPTETGETIENPPKVEETAIKEDPTKKADPTETPKEEEVIEDPPETKEEKSAVQRRINQLTYERKKAEADRDRLLSLLERNAPKKEEPEPEKEKTQFETVEEYTDYLVEKKLAEKMAKIDHAREQSEIKKTMDEHVNSFKEKTEVFVQDHSDFYEIVNDPNLRVTTSISDAIIESDLGPNIAYYLGKNPTELDRISKLTPYKQVMEIGKIETKLAPGVGGTAPKISKAPAPAKPLKGGVSIASGPAESDDMATWVAKERARLKKEGKIR